jgi:hypothetical protein
VFLRVLGDKLHRNYRIGSPIRTTESPDPCGKKINKYSLVFSASKSEALGMARQTSALLDVL